MYRSHDPKVHRFIALHALRGPVIGGTGHRPHKLGGYSKEAHQRLVRLAKEELERLTPSLVISGMALGWDMALAEAAIELKLPLLAAVPFPKQAARWPESSQEKYDALLRQASLVVVVGSDELADADIKAALQWRNEFMTDASTMMLAVFDGSHGGTFNCIKYAQARKVPVINVHEKWTEITKES